MNQVQVYIKEYERRFCTYSRYKTGDQKVLLRWIKSTDFNEHIKLANMYESMNEETMNDILVKYNISDTADHRETIKDFITAKYYIRPNRTNTSNITLFEKKYGLMVFYNYKFRDDYFKCMECWQFLDDAYWDYYNKKYKKIIKQCKWAPFLIYFAGHERHMFHFKSLREPFKLTEYLIYDIYMYMVLNDNLKKYNKVLEELQYSPVFVQHLAEKWQ